MSIVVAIITGVVTLAGVILSNSKSHTLMEAKIDDFVQKVERYNRLVERAFELERGLALVRNDVGPQRDCDGLLACGCWRSCFCWCWCKEDVRRPK